MADSMCNANWPPGTVRLTTLLGETKKDAEIVLQPRPTNDPNDPLNWSKRQKAFNFFLACLYAMMIFVFLNLSTVTWGPMGKELGFGYTLLDNTFSVGVAASAIGAPMLVPFALKFGSRPVFILSTAAQFAISIWAARTQTAGDLWGWSALSCWLGALANVLVQMTIAEMYFVHQRGTATAIYVWVVNFGASLPSVPAGYVTVDMGWRWVWWWCTIFFGVTLVVFFFGFRETKFPHAKRLDGRTGNIVPATEGNTPPDDASKSPHGDDITVKSNGSYATGVELSDQDINRRLNRVQINQDIPRISYWDSLALTTTSPGRWIDFFRHSWQPFMILVTIPGVLFGALVYAVVLAVGLVQVATYSEYLLLPPYNFSPAGIGLMSVPTFVGITIETLICGPLSDYIVIRLSKRNNGIYEPEFRFWTFLPFVLFLLAGSWWFGYALARGWSWPQVVLSLGVTCVGSGPLQSVSLTYILDAYNEIVGDALTGLTFASYAFVTIMLFALPPWIAAVGIAIVFNIIGAIGTVLLGFAIVLIWKGKRMRVKTARLYRYYAARQVEARPL